MKKYIASVICACMTVCLFGCSQSPAAGTEATTLPPTTAATQGTTAPATEPTYEEIVAGVDYAAPMAAISLPVNVQLETAESGTTIATYTYQDVDVTLPDADVAQAITLDLLNRIDKTQNTAQSVFAAAREAYSGQESWYPYSYTILYEPMRLDQNILSLFGTETSFDGSPRSVHNGVSVNYDLTTGESLALRTIFHEENYADALCDLIIASLSSKADSLYDDYESIVRSKFSTNVAVDNWYFSANGLCFYFAPYEIAAYSAGTVVAEISYEKLSGLLKDAYFPAEAFLYSGSVLAEVLSGDTAVLDEYSQFAEVCLEPGTQQILISTDGSVSNLQLRYGTGDPQSGITEATVLGAAGIGPGYAILVEVSVENAVGNLSIRFDSYGQNQILYLKQAEDGSLIFTK